MQTEIIKLNSLKASISSLFKNLTNKCQSTKDYDITVIVKQSQAGTASSNNSDSIKLQDKKINAMEFNDNPLILKQELSQSFISLDQNIHTFKSLKTDQSIEESKIPKMSNKIRFKKKQEKQNCDPSQQLKVQISNYAQTDQNTINKNMLTQFKIEDSCPNSQRYSYKLNNLKIQSQNSQDDSQAGDDADGGFLIENYLNQAVEYIDQCQMQKLQDFLYKFKEKYSFINVRTQTKWSLLMGYCKEYKLQFERAATNYSQVINYILSNPMMVTLEIADIYCRLGKCYFQIKEWNKAINAYSASLNIYKKNKKCLEYSNCISNLGVLYLQIGYFMQAERCFLMAFNIKRSQGDKKDKKYRMNLLQTYYNLFDCNLKLKNLLQCEQIIGNINTIIQQQQSHLNIIHKIRYYIKCAKLLFFQGKLQFCQNYYHHALNLFRKNNINNEEHAQALQLTGLLKQQVGDLQKSKFYYEKAYNVLQKCVSVQSNKLSILKKKLEHVNEALLIKYRDINKSKQAKNTMIIEQNKHFGEMKEKRRNQTAVIMRDMKLN